MKAKAVIAGVLALASAACSDNILGPPPSTDHTSVFEDIWKEFDLHYSFFQLKNIDWNAIGAKYRPQAAAAKSDVELAVVGFKQGWNRIFQCFSSISSFSPRQAYRSYPQPRPARRHAGPAARCPRSVQATGARRGRWHPRPSTRGV